MMKFYFAGGAQEIGGSCIYVRCGDKGIVFDCGIRQSGGKDPMPDLRGIQEMGGVDAILISHAHMDHIGTLPVLSKAYPAAPIFMNVMTFDLTRVLLADSLKLMDRAEDEIPKYSAEDVSAMLSRVLTLPYQSEREILPGIKLTLYPAGHIAGAACLYLSTPEGTIFYSGDVCGFSQQTIEGISLPKLRPDVAIMEATYGDRLHAVRSLEEGRLLDLIADCVAKGQKILIPAFALGRSQEVLLILRSGIQNGRIPEIPVYVDGMVRDINRVYQMNPTYLKSSLARRILKGNEPFYTDQILAVTRTQNRDELVEQKGSAIFVSSSGMLTGGPSVQYAKKLLPREDACVILTGYQDEEAPGRLLMDLLEEKEEERRITLDGITLPVKCQVRMVGLSAHADQAELCGIADRISARRLILVHGNPEALSALGESLSADYRVKVYQPVCGETLEFDIRKKREQLSADLPFVLHNSSFSGENDPEKLWEIWRTYYPGRYFTLEQMLCLWYGKKEGISEEENALFYKRIQESVCFSRYPRRMFLFQANTPEMISELTKPVGADINAIDQRARELLGDVSVKKFSFFPERKEVLLSVDFPDAFTADLKEVQEGLMNEFGWSLALKAAVNHQAAAALLSSLFGPRRKKTSYREIIKKYEIVLEGHDPEDEQKAETFRKKTGWQIICRYTDGTVLGENRDDMCLKGPDRRKVDPPLSDETWFLPPEGSAPVHQNMAQSVMMDIMEDAPVQPYKYSLKNDHNGKYFDLMFISPEAGLRSKEEIAYAAGKCGWRLHIADSVNQNALFAKATELFLNHGITMTKFPSYLPKQKIVMVKKATLSGASVSEESLEAIRMEFSEITGISMIFA